MFSFYTKYFFIILTLFFHIGHATEILPNLAPHHTDADFDPTEELELLDQRIEEYHNNPPLHKKVSKSRKKNIMLLGDSITYDSSIVGNRPKNLKHGYRNYLYYKLKAANYNFNFVGSRSAGSAVSPSFDTDNEGYPGFTSNQISSRIYSLLQQNRPDIILLHIGTNDTRDTGSSIDGLRNLLNKIDQFESDYNHHIKIFLAKIIRSSNSARNAHIVNFNANLVNLVNSRGSDDISIVNMYSGAGITNEDLIDYLHPKDGGYRKMASKWFNSVKHSLESVTQKPQSPSNLYASTITHNYAKLKWNDNSNNESGFKIYKNNTFIATVNSNIREYKLYNLHENTYYSYSVKAYNSDGTSSASSTNFTTKKKPIPTKPTNMTTASITDTTVTLKWKDNSSNESGFKIYKGSKLVATLGVNSTRYTLRGLTARTSYNYTIKAYNSSGYSSATSISFTTKDDYAWLIPVYNVLLN